MAARRRRGPSEMPTTRYYNVMGSCTLIGVMCTDCQARYPENRVDPPCPYCGSPRRTFLQSRNAEIKPQGTVEWLRTDKDDNVLGYGDSGRYGTTRHGNVEADNTLSLIIEGRPPQNEEDTLRVCSTLAAAMCFTGERFHVRIAGDRDVDGELRSQSRVLRIQVVRALADTQLWHKLALTMRLSQSLSVSGAVRVLKSSIRRKADWLPAAQRAQLILALDADRFPALALQPVVVQFRQTYAVWTAHWAFQQVWLVGPDPRLTWRLDCAQTSDVS